VGHEEDIAKLNEQLQALGAQQQAIGSQYTLFAQRVAVQIEKILRDAEVWDLIRALEVGREQKRAVDQAQADEIGKQIAALVEQIKLITADAQVEKIPVPPAPRKPKAKA